MEIQKLVELLSGQKRECIKICSSNKYMSNIYNLFAQFKVNIDKW